MTMRERIAPGTKARSTKSTGSHRPNPCIVPNGDSRPLQLESGGLRTASLQAAQQHGTLRPAGLPDPADDRPDRAFIALFAC
jgi:hypothetical protein